MDFKKKHVGVAVLMMVCLAGLVSGECIQYVTLTNMLGEDMIDDIIYIYQNNNLSQRFIKSVNYTEGEFTINCNTSYSVYLQPEPEMVNKNPANSMWFDYVLYGFLGAILTALFIIVLLIAVRGVLRK